MCRQIPLLIGEPKQFPGDCKLVHGSVPRAVHPAAQLPGDLLAFAGVLHRMVEEQSVWARHAWVEYNAPPAQGSYAPPTPTHKQTIVKILGAILDNEEAAHGLPFSSFTWSTTSCAGTHSKSRSISLRKPRSCVP